MYIIDNSFQYFSMQRSLEYELAYKIINNDCRNFS